MLLYTAALPVLLGDDRADMALFLLSKWWFLLLSYALSKVTFYLEGVHPGLNMCAINDREAIRDKTLVSGQLHNLIENIGEAFLS